jgi:hypothetical protein
MVFEVKGALWAGLKWAKTDRGGVPMDEMTIEREYPNRFRLRFLLPFFLFWVVFFGGISVGLLWVAITVQQDDRIFGIVRLQGEAAVLARWAAYAFFGILFIVGVGVFGILLWNRLTNPNQRIAFGGTGIFLPRNRFATLEEFVEYKDIRDIVLVRPGRPGGYGVSSIGFTVPQAFKVTTIGHHDINGAISMGFTAPQGVFRIARPMLNQEDFEDICLGLVRKVEASKGF